MKILVGISKTPETTAKISFTSDNKSFNPEGVQFIMNPYDEWFALVRALELKESAGGTVTAIHVGTSDSDVIIRKALAIGADNAVRIDAAPVDSFYVANQIAGYARDKGFDLLLFGKETIDFGGAEIPGMVAELLNLPFISFASNLQVEGNTAIASRDIEAGQEVTETELPLVVSAAKGMAEQRIPNMRGIMMAKSKPLEVIPPIETEERTNVQSYTLPIEKKEITMIDPENMDELVRLLHEESKVI